ncbi:trypsin-like serine protease [Vibrio alginolyticus]|nr:trypsin-like serine protease [Vibrio alginolyticus]
MKNLRNKYLSAVVFPASILLPLSVNAVEVSEGEMPKEMYKDFFVQLQINTLVYGRPVVTACAGTLVGGEYIITAQHCVNNPDDFTMKIIQGHDTSAPDAVYENVSYEVRYSRNAMNDCRTRELAVDIYAEHVDGQYINELGRDVVNVIDNSDHPEFLDECFDWAEGYDENYSFNYSYDIAVLKLNQVIPHKDTAVLAKTFDADGEYLPIGEEVEFYGWGELSDGTTPSVPQKATLNRESSRFWPVYDRVTEELDSMGDWLRVETPCSTDPEVMNDVNYHCRYEATWAEMYFNPTNSVSFGDSGSPLVHNDKVYGVISGYSNWNQENTHRRSRIISFSYLEEWLKEEISGLAYPSKLVMDATQNATLDITVQNFTNDVVMPDDYEGDVMAGLAIAQACTAALAPFESCTVSLVVDAELLAIEEDLEVVIPFTDSEQFVVTLQGPVEVPEVTDPDVDESETDETETDGTDTDETDSDNTETDTDTEGSETDSTETDETETEGTGTEGSETDNTGTEGSETDTTETDESETDSSETDGSETDNTDTGTPSTGETDQETDQTETDNTETDESDTTETDTGNTDTDTETSEQDESRDSDSGKSGGSTGWFVLLVIAGLARFRARS